VFRAALLLFLAACNQIYGLDPTRTRPMDGRVCDRGAPFGAATEVAIAGTNIVEAVRFTANRAVAYLSLCPTSDIAGCDIYTSPYSTETESFAGFSKMTGVSMDGAYDTYPTITKDNQHLVFASSRGGLATDPHIFVAKTNNGSFDTPTITLLPGIDTPANEPFITGGGRVLYYSAELSTGEELFRMEGEPPLFGGAPRAVAETNMPGVEEYAPVASEDELELFFGAGVTVRSLDLYLASRSSTMVPFGAPEKLSLSTLDIDYPVSISPNGCDLYYISKPGGVAKVFVAKR